MLMKKEKFMESIGKHLENCMNGIFTEFEFYMKLIRILYVSQNTLTRAYLSFCFLSSTISCSESIIGFQTITSPNYLGNGKLLFKNDKLSLLVTDFLK